MRCAAITDCSKHQTRLFNIQGLFIGFIIASALMLSGCASTTTVQNPQAAAWFPTDTIPPYAYPITDPYAATILGTPPDNRASNLIPVQFSQQSLTVYPKRRVPEGFWYNRALQYGQKLQTGPAPLVFVIAGTGAPYDSNLNQAIGQILYNVGYSVVLLPSPTHSNFIVTASSNFVPGHSQTDANDLLKVINLIHSQLKNNNTPITSVNLTGYSLGAWHAAFTARADALQPQQKQLNFNRVLLINPPLSLYNSIQKIDDMLYRGLPNGVAGLDDFIRSTVARLAFLSQSSDALAFQNDWGLINAFYKLNPSQDFLASVIGTAFRLSAANMILTSDIMKDSGYIFPPQRAYRSTTAMDTYLSVALRTRMQDYFSDLYLPTYGNNRNQLIAQSSLASIGGWLRSQPRIGLITNQDDIILTPGDLNVLTDIFGSRAKVFPNGGHLGNVRNPAVVHAIGQFFWLAPTPSAQAPMSFNLQPSTQSANAALVQ